MYVQTKSSSDGNSTDDEFYIVDADKLSESNDSEFDEPVVKWLGTPPPMIENYFSVPAERKDVLSAPNGFPAPLIR